VFCISSVCIDSWSLVCGFHSFPRFWLVLIVICRLLVIWLEVGWWQRLR
jgi:hypothetical protein